MPIRVSNPNPDHRQSGRVALTFALAVAALLLIWVASLGRDIVGQDPSRGLIAPETSATSRVELQRGNDLATLARPTERTSAAPDARVRLQGPGRLTGVVLARENNLAVPDVEVRLLSLPPSTGVLLARVTDMMGMGEDLRRKTLPVATTLTDGAGQFEFTGVREGRWYVDVLAPHRVSETAATVRVVASGSGGPVELWTRAGGRVLGTVHLPDERPAPGARVMLVTGAMSFLGVAQTGDIAFAEMTADREGRFEFSAVPPHDDYELSVVGEGFAVTHHMGVVVRAGEDTVVRLVTDPGATITGRVFSRALDSEAMSAELDSPLHGAQVGAVPRGLRHLRFVKEILAASHGTTDEDGGYVLRNVPAGEVDVLAIAPDHVPGRGALVRIGAGGDHVAPDFALERGPKVRGRVVDTAGRPIAGVRVIWNVVDFRALEGEITLAPLMAAGMREFSFPLTDAEGRFVAGAFPGQPPYALRFACTGFKEESFRWQPAEHGGDVEITLRRGGAVAGRVVAADDGAPLIRFTLSTSNRVESLAGEPSRWNPFAAGREIESVDGRFLLDSLEPGRVGLVVSAPGYIDVPLSIEVLESETTDAGTLTLARGATIRGRVIDSAGAPVAGAQVTTDGRIEGTFQRLEGNRMAAERAAGVPDDFARRRRPKGVPPLGFLRYFASLGLAGDGVEITATDGSFELLGLDAGAHEVMVFHRDYVAGTAGPFELETGVGREGVEVTLLEGGGIFGTVSDRHGRLIEGATVLAASPGLLANGAGSSKGGVHQSRTDSKGGYVLRHMQGGGYFLIVTRSDVALSPMTLLGTLNLGLVNVPNEGQRRHDIVDTSSGACRVHGFVRAEGEPVGRGSLVAFNFEAEGLLGVDVKVTNVEPDGSYEFAGLSPGEYQVQYDGPGPNTKFLIDVDDAPEMRLDIDLPSARIAGRVIDAATGLPVPGAELRLEPRDFGGGGGLLGALLQGEAQAQRKTTGDDGEFRFERLAAGRYRLSVAGPNRGEQRGAYTSPAALSLELREDERLAGLELELPTALRIEGRLVDDSGALVSNGVVLARPSKDPRMRPETADVRADGSFVLGGLGPGTWNITARAEGYAPASRAALELDAEGLPEGLEFVLERGLEVTARVTTPSGLPVEGAVATLIALDGVPEAGLDPGRFLLGFFTGEATTDTNGELGLGVFGSGPHQLRVRRGFSEVERTVELPRGGGAHVLEVDLP